MPRGQKECQSCGNLTGPRAYSCPKCSATFLFKAQTKEQKTTKLIKNVDWKMLVQGDRIKVNGGPYFVNKSNEYVPMGYRGKFTVQKIDNDGILAYSSKGGFCYIYMGPDKQDSETKIFKTKHKLIKLKKKNIT